MNFRKFLREETYAILIRNGVQLAEFQTYVEKAIGNSIYTKEDVEKLVPLFEKSFIDGIIYYDGALMTPREFTELKPIIGWELFKEYGDYDEVVG